MTDHDAQICTEVDAAHLEGRAKGLELAHDIARATGHDDLATRIADERNEALLLAGRIRRQADDAEVVTVH
jgi:hypothetical protein